MCSRCSGVASRSLVRISSRRCSARGGGASRRVGRSGTWAHTMGASRLSTKIRRFTGQSSGARAPATRFAVPIPQRARDQAGRSG
jgi:hypothetical protein